MGWDEADHRTGISKGDGVAAATALSKRAASVRAWIVMPIIVASVLLGVGATMLLSGLGVSDDEFVISKGIVAVTFGLPMAVGVVLARSVSKLAVRRLGRSWAAEIARKYGVSSAALEDITRYWD